MAIDPPARITAALAQHDPQMPGLRWLSACKMHLTLCFLAAVPEDIEEPLIDALAEIREPPFKLALKSLGRFARAGYPAVVWAGVECASPLLWRLQRQVCDAARAVGIDPGGERFHPHLTVGRCKGLYHRSLKPLLEMHARSDFGSFEVDGFTLYSSVLRPGGAEYHVVFRQRLGDGCLAGQTSKQ
ncbi:MAG: RNA 2',3'-cyclic phosphodiesterase [Verrucomicrobia bacterium]|nr:RNA 2',3'-cyclic phosphodiesterase [Verrucomicrobiota bacterium]